MAISQKRLGELAPLKQEAEAVAAAQAQVPEVTENRYQERLLKYIPADVIAIYSTLQGLSSHAPGRLVRLGAAPGARSICKTTKNKQIRAALQKNLRCLETTIFLATLLI